MPITRRRWIQDASSLVASPLIAGLGINESGLCGDEQPTKWEIGCFNRPWMPWSYDNALDGIKTAGFTRTGILGDHVGETFTSHQATAQQIDHLKQRIEARKLQPIVGWLRTAFDIPLAESIQQTKTQIDHAHALGLKYMLTVGVDPPEQYARFYQVMSAAAEYGADKNVQIVIKPHGGISGSATDLLRCVDKVGHDNFRIWYDAGNLIHYTGKDPVEDIRQLRGVVTGFCAKDCGGRGQGVMLNFGAGKVDFLRIFNELKKFNFTGPILVECCGGQSQEEVTAGARMNRLFLQDLIGRL